MNRKVDNAFAERIITNAIDFLDINQHRLCPDGVSAVSVWNGSQTE